MEDEINGAVPCSSLAVDSILRVGTAGAIWGLCMGPYDARKQGLSGVARASFVAKAVGKFGFQYGLVAGIYMITRCGIQRYRRQNDWVSCIRSVFVHLLSHLSECFLVNINISRCPESRPFNILSFFSISLKYLLVNSYYLGLVL
nr:outer envelope pore protein 16-4, chloroplastic-like [Quercus suber]